MRAWLLDSDGVERLRLGEMPDPQPGPAQVLLNMRVAALNPADAFLARRMYPAKPPLQRIRGRDGVGDVLAVGPGVDHVHVGETLGILRGDAGVNAWGTLAEQVVVPAESVIRIPPGLVPRRDGWRPVGFFDRVAGLDAVERASGAS